MLEGPPDVAEIDAAARAWGLVIERPAQAEPLCEVWAEHWPAVRIFAAMQTQWVVGFNGVEGLNYAALPAVEQRLGITPGQSRRAFPHLQALEAEGLRWHRNRS